MLVSSFSAHATVLMRALLYLRIQHNLMCFKSAFMCAQFHEYRLRSNDFKNLRSFGLGWVGFVG